MKTSIIALASGAVLIGLLAMSNAASSEIMNYASGADRPVVIDPDDVPGSDPPRGSDQIIEVNGPVLEVAASALVIDGAGLTPVMVAVPGTAEITRDGEHVELSAIIPGDHAKVDAVLENGVLTARVVKATKLR